MLQHLKDYQRSIVLIKTSRLNKKTPSNDYSCYHFSSML